MLDTEQQQKKALFLFVILKVLNKQKVNIIILCW